MLIAFLMTSSLRSIYTLGEYQKYQKRGIKASLVPGMMLVNSYIVGAVSASATGIGYVTIKWLLA